MADEEKQESGGGKKKKLIIIIGVVLLLLIGLAVGAVMFLGGSKEEAPAGPSPEQAAQAALVTAILTFILPALIGLFFLAGWVWRKQIHAG